MCRRERRKSRKGRGDVKPKIRARAIVLGTLLTDGYFQPIVIPSLFRTSFLSRLSSKREVAGRRDELVFSYLVDNRIDRLTAEIQGIG